MFNKLIILNVHMTTFLIILISTLMYIDFGLKNLSRNHPYFRERLYSMTFAMN